MDRSYVDLLWLPLGAGDNSGLVRRSGRAFEALSARREHRQKADLFHSALEVSVDGEQFAVEMTPAWGLPNDVDRGVAATGSVGIAGLGRSRFFRYEVHAWRGGVIPDAAYAFGPRQRLSADRDRARSILRLVPAFPTHTWGRDEQGTGDMWNSNSLTAWLLLRSGHDLTQVHFPAHGRAPGWSAGLTVAARDLAATHH